MAIRFHIYVCTKRRENSRPCCACQGSETLLRTLQHEIRTRHLDEMVAVHCCNCLDACGQGPVVVVVDTANAGTDVDPVALKYRLRGEPKRYGVQPEEVSALLEALAGHGDGTGCQREPGGGQGRVASSTNVSTS